VDYENYINQNTQKAPNVVGYEVVTPTLPFDELMKDYTKIRSWMRRTKCYTTYLCGLHMNISLQKYVSKTDANTGEMQETTIKNLNMFKFLLLSGDENIAREYGRQANGATPSLLNVARNEILRNPSKKAEALEKLEKDLLTAIDKMFFGQNTLGPMTGQYRKSIVAKPNIHNIKYLECRSPGYMYLDKSVEDIERTLLTYIVALYASCHANEYRKIFKERLRIFIETAANTRRANSPSAAYSPSPNAQRSPDPFSVPEVSNKMDQGILDCLVSMMCGEMNSMQAGIKLDHII